MNNCIHGIDINFPCERCRLGLGLGLGYKNIQYLSPTSIAKWHENPDEFYLWYLAPVRPPKIPQTQPMAVGSAFDAFVKSYLYESLIGKNPQFERTTLFEAQVESHNRDGAFKAGEYCFKEYLKSGALADLMIELQSAVGEPRFEIEVKGVINGYREGVSITREGVMLLGKPDVFFINSQGAHVILDWKVNGYYSDHGASPMSGYVKIRNDPKNSGCHKDCWPMMHNGILINGGQYLENLNADWARQLSIYGWVCGCQVGEEIIVAIDQLACRGGLIRVANHRLRVSAVHQWKIFIDAQRIWEIVHSDHIFRDLSKEESIGRCNLLDAQVKSLNECENEADEWFRNVTRGQ